MRFLLVDRRRRTAVDDIETGDRSVLKPVASGTVEHHLLIYGVVIPTRGVRRVFAYLLVLIHEHVEQVWVGRSSLQLRCTAQGLCRQRIHRRGELNLVVRQIILLATIQRRSAGEGEIV